MIVTLLSLIYIGAMGPVADVNAPFPQESSTFYGTAQGLPSDEVSSIALLPDGTPVAASANQLFAFREGRWVPFEQQPGFPVTKLRVIDGALWAAGDHAVKRLANGAWEGADLPDAQVVDFAQGSDLVIATAKGVLPAPDATERLLDGKPVKAVAVQAGYTVIAADNGLYAAKGSELQAVHPADERYSWAPRGVTALTVADGTLWAGMEQGVAAYRDGQWRLFTGKEGLPYNRFTCAAPGEPGVVWFGTEHGAIRYDGDRWSYRAGKRWLPDDRVNAIAVEPNGTAWLATPKGVSRIERRPMTLAEKAAWFEKLIDERHTRMGFVVRCTLEEEANFDTAWINHTDNDGLYTSMYGGSQALRYGATKDPEAKARAKRCFQAVKLLFDVTGIPGFPARSVIPVDWPKDPNEGFGEEANLRMQKEDPLWKNIVPRWPKSADGKYYWKCDTSSDEISGHYFFFGLYYDLVAETPEEKAEVVELTRALTNHIVDNGFKLIDHDGLPTRWANWSPEYVNSIDGGWFDRGLQAIEILSFLNVAQHVTGDQKFADTARTLRDKYAYHINAISSRAMFPPDHVVPWDNNLAFLGYYGLLKYETDPDLLRTYRASLDNGWLFSSRQNDPFFNFVFAAVLPNPDQPVGERGVVDFDRVLRKGVDTLRGTPLLLLGWEMNNSHRLDVMLDPTPGQRPAYGSSAFNEALPIEERSHIRINSDHFDLDASRGGGFSEYEGTFYLLPYYLGLYHGFVK